MVVLILVCVWIAVLTPRAVRFFREDRSQGSIESFHQQLHLLERTGPKLVPPAHTLETDQDDAVSGDAFAGPATAPDLVLLGSGGAGSWGPASGPASAPASAPASTRSRWIADHARADRQRRGRRRRRDILLGLGAVAVISGGLGAMHGLHLVWVATAAAVVLAVGFVALAAYAQLLDADRQATRPIVPTGRLDPASRRLSRPRHAAPGTERVEVLDTHPAWAARAGYPGAWDEESDDAPRRVAAGG